MMMMNERQQQQKTDRNRLRRTVNRLTKEIRYSVMRARRSNLIYLQILQHVSEL